MFTEYQMDNAVDDKDLLEMIRNHNDHAFDLLYKKYWYPLIHYAKQFFDDKDTCKEVVQELFVHLHTRHHSLNISSSVSSYLFRALRNRVSNYQRNMAVYKKHVTLAIGEYNCTQNDVEQFMNVNELQKVITLSLKEMPPKYSEVYVLHYQYYFTLKKIGLILNRPVDTVEKQLRKAKELLRNQLKSRLSIQKDKI